MVNISVITPIYRAEEYLEQCLQSLVTQSLESMELIWIDNGASEACKRIIERYSKQHSGIRVVTLQENIGYCGAVNRGLDIATGEYVGFCDSDDWVESDYYQKLYTAAKKFEADMAYTEYFEEYADGKQRHIRHLVTDSYVTSRSSIFKAVRHGSIWDKIFKRSLIAEHGIRLPDSTTSYNQDTSFMVQAMVHASSLALINDTFYHYNIIPTSTIRDTKTIAARQRHSIELAGNLFNYASKYNFSQEERTAFFNFVYSALTLDYILKKNKHFLQEIKKIDCGDVFFTNKLIKTHARHHPSFMKRVFSIHPFESGYIVYLLGFKITLKK